MAVPKIRFPGFTEDWEQRKLGEISEKVTTKNQDMVVNEVFTNSAEYGIISQQDFFDKDIANSNKVDGYYLVEPDDFVYNPRISNSAPFGPIKRNKLGRSGAMSPLYYVFRSHDVDKSYLDWFFQTNRWHAFMRFHGNTGVRSDRFAITDKIFAEMTISIPQDIDEQKAIGTFFTALDDSITLHQRKLESMKLLKKSLLQKMFPKSGETVPEVRFPGFTDAWEQRKFVDFAQRESTLKLSCSDCPSVEYEDVIAEEGRLNKDIRQKEIQKTGIYFNGSQVLYGKLRPYLHNWLNPDFTGVAVGDWWVLRPSNMDKSFLYRLLQTDQFDAVANQSSGSKMPRADWKLVSNTEFIVPHSEKEQHKIAEFFNSIDDLITLHQRKVEILHKLKKSLLRQMFV